MIEFEDRDVGSRRALLHYLETGGPRQPGRYRGEAEIFAGAARELPRRATLLMISESLLEIS
jgi:hypothetical protein